MATVEISVDTPDEPSGSESFAEALGEQLRVLFQGSHLSMRWRLLRFKDVSGQT